MRVPAFFSDASKKLFLHFSMAGLFCIITLQLLFFGHSLENLLIFRASEAVPRLWSPRITSDVQVKLTIPCPIPRPHYSARPKRFGSRGPARSPRIRHRSELSNHFHPADRNSYIDKEEQKG